MVDVSHPSKQANLQAIALSRAPVIASHSAARALADHSRNMDDEQLMALKKNGGVIQTVAFDSYVKIKPPESPERVAAVAALRKEFGLEGEDVVRAAYLKRGAPSSASAWPRWTSNIRRREWPPSATSWITSTTW